jgi:hypothetical protein
MSSPATSFHLRIAACHADYAARSLWGIPVFASVTNYAALYPASDGDLDARENLALPRAVAAFAESHGLGRHLDVRRPADLATHSPPRVAQMLNDIRADRGSYLTTCLGVLQRVDRAHIAAAIRTLHALTERFLVVAISTRPSGADNLYHPTLMPISTWAAIFRAADFRRHATDAFDAAGEDAAAPVPRWIAADIFDDARQGALHYLAFEKGQGPASWDVASDAIDALTDVAFRELKRAEFSAPPGRINFNLHHTQEWSLIRPILDVLPRGQVRVLLRPDGFDEDCLRAITGQLQRNGVETLVFSEIGELPWRDLRHEIVITGAESSVGATHLMAQEVVAMARLHGCRTFLLQHGIWPRSFDRRVVTFASEHYLTWGQEEQIRLNRNTHEIFAATMPWGLLPDDQVQAVGAAKFTDHLLGTPPDLSITLGFEAGAFAKTVLIGTKNLRGRWSVNAGFADDLQALVSRHPEVLFIIKPHPTDAAEDYAFLKSGNVRLIDEVTSILADLPMSRIIPRVDLVVTSPSSMILDGAITDRPVFVYDTGQPIEFDGVSAAPLAELHGVFDGRTDSAPLVTQARRFRARYAEAVDGRFYARLSTLLNAKIQSPRVDPATAITATLAMQAVSHARSETALRAQIAARDATIAAARTTEAELTAALERLLHHQTAERSQVPRDRSRRYAGAFRSAAAWVSRITRAYRA